MQRVLSVFRGTIGKWTHETELPFLVFLTFVFVFIYAWSVFTSPVLRNPVWLTLFSVLFLIHLALQWLSIYWVIHQWNGTVYLGIQAALVFTLVSIAGSSGPSFGLYLGLLGVSIGMERSNARRAVAILFLLVLSIVNFVLINGLGAVQLWVLAMVPTTVFVIIYVVLYARQGEARRKAQELLAELGVANRELAEYAGRVEDLTLAAERQRMARELHDTLAQGLAGLILQLEAVDSHLTAGRPERAREIVEQSMDRARKTLAESRQAIDNLRTERSAPEDLDAAIRSEADQFCATAGYPCKLDLDLPPDCSEPRRDLILRTVAEGLQNTARHAHASAASVGVRQDDYRLMVEIRDNGCGFDPAAVPPGHYGLLGLRERARAEGGSVEIESAPGAGTLLRLVLPEA